MAIALLCPNNHKLFCPESLAGKRGKCPHCGATFRVPATPPPGASSPNVTAAKPVALVEGGSSPSKLGPISIGIQTEEPQESLQPAPPNPIRAYEDGEEINSGDLLFFCPHGHQLHGPESLGGTEGECPVCGAEFLVPTAADLADEDEASEPGLDNFLSNLDGTHDDHEDDARGAPSLSELFESFWAYRAQGATVELHLGDGKVLIPDGYAPQLSHRGQGVFMRREANGSYTLSCINWDSISHVAVKGVRNLPEGLFDLPGTS